MKVKNTVRIISIALLVLLGIGAVYGGVTLIIDPSGELLGLPLKVLENAPFKNFFIPGFILLIMIGLLPFYIVYAVVKRIPKYEWMVIAQGSVLVIWLTVEVVMGIFDPFIHPVYYIMGTLLIILGTVLSLGSEKNG